jgi:hypothetical protein
MTKTSDDPTETSNQQPEASEELQSQGWWLAPFKWLSQEEFWRDASSNFIGAGAVVLMGFLFAKISGYITVTPSTSFQYAILRILVIVLIDAVLIAGIIAVGGRSLHRLKTPHHVGGVGAGILKALVYIVGTTSALIGIIVSYGISAVIMDWLFL